MSSITRTTAWQALAGHHAHVVQTSLPQRFAADPERFSKFSLRACGILLDYSKNHLDAETLPLLLALAQQAQLPTWIEKMFVGEPVNSSENRPALHSALRNRSDAPVMVAGRDVMPDVRLVLAQMRQFTTALRSGEWRGYSGKRITDVVNIGIGGSHMGPSMVCAALEPYASEPRVHFVSNVDGAHLATTLKTLNPETTLFIVSSKSFTTAETMANAHSARDWLLSTTKNPDHIARHFVAVSCNPQAVAHFGIAAHNRFEFWDWVGGRYSLWSAIGLPIAVSIGMDHFEAMLDGAYEMDEHFRHTPLAQNMPVILGLLSVWYINFFDAQSFALLPYDQSLRLFADHIQQVSMESCGKSISRDGESVDYATEAVIWGGAGTNGQHSFYQLLHQGSPFIPADFIAALETHYPTGLHHAQLLANFIAQPEALMMGRVEEGLPAHQHFVGNRPSNAILFQKVTPRSLGALVALYEHKTYVQSVIWNINAFDQWGVELGKELAQVILSQLTAAGSEASVPPPRGQATLPSPQHDSSTSALLEVCRAALIRP
jgi:glucose-6-phosphate isomerase